MGKYTLGKLYDITEWITKFAYLNFLWIIFTFLGLGFLGFFPSTTAMFTVVRKWIMKEESVPVFQTFWLAYKKDFVKAQLLGLLMVSIGLVIYLDLNYILANGTETLKLVNVPLFILVLILFMTMLYLFPVFVHFDLKTFAVLKNAFYIMLINPLLNVFMLIVLVVTYFVMFSIPGLSFFFGGSFVTSIIMAFSYLAFQTVEKKKQAAK